MALAIDLACGSSPSLKMSRASSPSGRSATRSAALGPLRDMRMSKGPSTWNEKPRSPWSSWNDETPRSNTIPSTDVTPIAASAARMSPNGACRRVSAGWAAASASPRAMASGSRSKAITRHAAAASMARVYPPPPKVAST